jgi:hypothetical protein
MIGSPGFKGNAHPEERALPTSPNALYHGSN